MTELRFRKDLYRSEAVDRTVSVFEPHVRIERGQDGGAEILKVFGDDPQQEREIAGEIANYVLGVTVELSTQAGGAP
jgi:hypothetical protein